MGCKDFGSLTGPVGVYKATKLSALLQVDDNILYLSEVVKVEVHHHPSGYKSHLRRVYLSSLSLSVAIEQNEQCYWNAHREHGDQHVRDSPIEDMPG